MKLLFFVDGLLPKLRFSLQNKFNDITSGDIKCKSVSSNSNGAPICCSAGFSASAGWDPATGTCWSTAGP